MPFTPPTGINLELNFSGSYTAPTGENVELVLGNVLENYIRTRNCVLNLSSEILIVTEAVLFGTADTIINLTSSFVQVDPLIHVNAHNSVLEISSDFVGIQILPDMVISSCEIGLFSAKEMVGGGTVTDLPMYLNPGMTFSWGGNSKTDTFHEVIWGSFAKTDVFNNVCMVIEFPHIDVLMDSPWKSFYTTDNVHSSKYRDYEFHTGVETDHPWKYFLWTDKFVDVIYKGRRNADKEINYRYNDSVPKDSTSSYVWNTDTIQCNSELNVVWGDSRVKNIDYVVNWGPKELYKYCFEVYEPPPSHRGINFVFPPRNAVFDGTWDKDIHFIMDSYSSDPRCGYEHMYTGIRDINPGNPPVVPYYEPFKVKQVYYMYNSVLVKTIPSNIDIEVLGLSITTDMDSWLWQVTMSIGKKQYLDLVRPSSPGGFKKVEININGWKWIFVIESWSENLSFPKGTWNVTGRSPSLILGDPICEPKSFVNETASTGSALMQTILDASYGYSVYTVDWTSYGGAETQTGFDPAAPGATWNIPANGFSYSNQTNIQAIQLLADSIGAYVQSNQYFDGTVPELISIAPRYPYQPWNWSLMNTDIDFVQLDRSLILEMGSTYKKNPDYYGVYLVGTAGKDGDAFSAAFGNVYRDGYGPSSAHAPLVSNPLFTTDEVLREYGRKVLAESGMWADHSVRVFSLFPEGRIPGLLRVGTMVNMTNPLNVGDNFQGIVKSLNITAAIVNKSAFSVSQNITVAQYLGEWDE